jgi:hypothetical protein
MKPELPPCWTGEKADVRANLNRVRVPFTAFLNDGETNMWKDIQEIFGEWTVTLKGIGMSSRFSLTKDMKQVTWYIETHSITGRRRGWITNGYEREEADPVHLETVSKGK